MKREDCEKGLYVSFLWEGEEKIGKVEFLGKMDAWVNCLGTTWLVPYNELRKAPADKPLEYIEAELRTCDKIAGIDKEQEINKEHEIVKVSSVEGRHVYEI